MAYNALYRRFRPDTFAGIIGQSHITTILLNQIRSGRIAHAYLFCGSRGTGKTSTARILAKAINCLSPEDGEPCGRCDACTAENNVDIIEIDAASNSRVEEMRALIERAEFAPLNSKKKVYIIDEAHMLTKNASNALLKTLEEPPEHVVFILATTEPQMLPATIVSRCQRFEFHRLSVSDMVSSLKQNLDSIGAHIEDEGLIAIARAAEGGMRDCLSIADQCLSFCGDNVTEDDVLSVLGSVNTGFLFKMADAVIDSDTASVMRGVADASESGRDMGVFTLDLAAHFRALLLTKICGNCMDILDCTEETMRDYTEQAQRISKERAERAVEELLKLQLDLRIVNTPRTLVESTLLRICRPEDEKTVTALTDRVAQLEGALNDIKKVAAQAAKEAAAIAAEGVSAAPSSNAPVPEAKKESLRRESEHTGDKSAPAGERKPSSATKKVTVPPATANADELFNRLMSKLKEPGVDPTVAITLMTAKAHWLSEGVLHICFDIEGQNLYNYANEPFIRSVIYEAAQQSIAPVTVELDLKREGRIEDGGVRQLFGVPIEDI